MSMQGRHTDESFVAFVSATSGRLIAHAELLCGDPDRARDIVQSVLARAYPRWRRIERDDPYAYLCRSVTNAVTDWWRKAHRRLEQAADVVPESTAASDHTVDLENRQILFTALRTLTLRERTVIVLRYLQDYSEQDTAHTLDISVGTVKSTCHKALRKLRLVIDSEAAEVGPDMAATARTPIERTP